MTHPSKRSNRDVVRCKWALRHGAENFLYSRSAGGFRKSKNHPGPRQKVSLIFEMESEEEKGRHSIVYKRFTRSLNEKAALRKFLEKWRGSRCTPAELQHGIDLENRTGMSATLFIVHNEPE